MWDCTYFYVCVIYQEMYFMSVATNTAPVQRLYPALVSCSQFLPTSSHAPNSIFQSSSIMLKFSDFFLNFFPSVHFFIFPPTPLPTATTLDVPHRILQPWVNVSCPFRGPLSGVEITTPGRDCFAGDRTSLYVATGTFADQVCVVGGSDCREGPGGSC